MSALPRLTVLRAMLALGLWLAACGAWAQSQRELWNRPAEPFRIIDNIYYVGTEGLASYLITTRDGHFLLDGCLDDSVPLIRANIEKLGFKLADIKYLLNSHAHFDHSGGLAQLKQLTGAKLIASEGDRSALEGGFYLGWEQEQRFRAPPVKVDRTIADGEKLALGGIALTANLTPGHTRGCTSWSMPASEGGKSYQVLFFCSSSVAANRLVGPPQYEGIVADYEKTFARAKTLTVDVFLGPHPEFYGMRDKRQRQRQGGPNPFIELGEFAAFIAKSEVDFRSQLAAQQQKQ
jgi:metallo-beta-lactamase class B